MTQSGTGLRIALEEGKQKVFASAIDWPGWSRSGKKTPGAAIDELLVYRHRYNEMLSVGHIQHVLGDAKVEIVQTRPGTATTDFGVPDVQFDADAAPLDGKDLERWVRIVRASWEYFDAVAATVSVELQKGPRGGGRDREKLRGHVHEAERSYARYLGVRTPPRAMDTPDGLSRHREDVITAIEHFGRTGEDVPRKWSLRYFVRRMVWHTLDHAWEMQDKDLSERGTP